ncbi:MULTISPECIES: hypothetical protein [Pseudoalteromonas]|uniref:Uncharacterized protein n=1 Tax=Pseudoalteromonas luteoviolacea (strain 2ta16) TaxID=1353533 RepID=V4J869_PSEL2|nr:MULTISPECIES: hypothetical protein [Pseudoalteromonas]ESP91442.1 hypothetical protein PL2TA16_00241 [Pseudoalteromonas luteoviolacea 2ta16]KZN40092.1 hypothetical protein N483_18055 [Pseudoalteromonas luteoviolacea NCIMB 1944]MCG7551218.1 hypothetical protein [Pseudoalteromonas sp. Of7M-16]
MKTLLIGVTFALATAVSAISTANAAGSPFTICKYKMTQGAPDYVRPPGSDYATRYLSGHVTCPSTHMGGWGIYALISQRHVN